MARSFGNSAEFWHDLQARCDLEPKKREMEDEDRQSRRALSFSPSMTYGIVEP